MAAPLVERIGDGVYQVGDDGRTRTIYVARNAAGWWAFADGEVFRGDESADAAPHGRRRRAGAASAAQAVTAPMPATVLRVLVEPGARVGKGDTVVVLEAMKMELPLRASGDATVRAVHCREGDLVQADTVLMELA